MNCGFVTDVHELVLVQVLVLVRSLVQNTHKTHRSSETFVHGAELESLCCK